MVIFIVAMMGGGITLIDDKARGLREGCLTMPIHKTELVMGLIGSGALKGIMAGMVLTIIGGLIAGIPRLWDPIRLFYLAVVVLAASVALIGFMFLIMVRVDDPLVPCAVFGVLNTLLFSPFGAVFQSRGSRGRFAGSRSSIGSHIPCLHSGTSPLKIQALKGFTWTC
jgi:ABC-2 type transport system permease protein